MGEQQLVDVPSDEIQPISRDNKPLPISLIFLLIIMVGGLLFRLRRGK